MEQVKHTTHIRATPSSTPTGFQPGRRKISPHLMEEAWAGRQSMSYQSVQLYQVLSSPLSLSAVLVVPSASWVLCPRPPSVSMELSKDYAKQDLEPHLFLRQYFPWVLDFTWLILDCSKSYVLLVFPPGVLFCFLNIPFSPSPEVRLDPLMKPRVSDPISTGMGYSDRNGLQGTCDILLRCTCLSFPDVPVTVIMNH